VVYVYCKRRTNCVEREMGGEIEGRERGGKREGERAHCGTGGDGGKRRGGEGGRHLPEPTK
jgi:hypothetical protein